MTIVRQIPEERRAGAPGLAVLASRFNGVPMEEALRKADAAVLAMASNKRMSEAIVRSDEWLGIRDALPCWTGTMTAYDTPGRKLGKEIEYVDPETGIRYVFPVPEEHQDKRDIILVAEHPGFRLEADGKDRVVLAPWADAVESFPSVTSVWRSGDPAYDIPRGFISNPEKSAARYLWRIEKRVGLAVRDAIDSFGFDYRCYIDLRSRPSALFGVVAEDCTADKPETSGSDAVREKMQAYTRFLRHASLE